MRKIYLLMFLFLFNSCISIPFSRGIEPLTEQTMIKGSKDKILVININGTIHDSQSRKTFLGSAETNISSRVAEELDKAAEDSSIKSIIFRIDSPGGSVTTCDILHNLITEHKKKSKQYIVAHMGSIAASGGYYLSVTADKIIAHPTTVTGSIGVVAFMVNMEGLLQKIGIEDQTIKSGSAKTMGSPFKKMTKQDRALFQKIIDSMYNRFITVILEGRPNLTRKSLLKIADGRVMIASDALDYGLIDDIGYWQEAVKAAENGAGINNPTIITYSRPGNYHPNAFTIKSGSESLSLNLISIDSSEFLTKYGISFMYLWKM
ncbi:MAG: signal peptide peptidase SppA [Spirochaetes bacterium]|nr:signal peptide peptidase SppA [Spirochaetota bacterium]MBN2771183.1 signal peptide peptidase SppA [Spirochaetota bacterium]